LEGQRPRLTHFQPRAKRNPFQTAPPPKPLDLLHMPIKKILPTLRRRFAAESWDAKGLACPTLGLRSALPRDSAIVCLGRDAAPSGSDLRGNAAFSSSRDADAAFS
jgi:hypothetical protein